MSASPTEIYVPVILQMLGNSTATNKFLLLASHEGEFGHCVYITSRFWILFLPNLDPWSQELGELQKEGKAMQWHQKEGKGFLLQAIPVK